MFKEIKENRDQLYNVSNVVDIPQYWLNEILLGQEIGSPRGSLATLISMQYFCISIIHTGS